MDILKHTVGECKFVSIQTKLVIVLLKLTLLAFVSHVQLSSLMKSCSTDPHVNVYEVVMGNCQNEHGISQRLIMHPQRVRHAPCILLNLTADTDAIAESGRFYISYFNLGIFCGSCC